VNVFLVHFAKQPVVLVRQKCVVELNEKSGIDNGPILFSERIRQGGDDCIFVRVITIDPKAARAHRRGDRQEGFLDFHASERRPEIIDILRDGGLPAIADRARAVPKHLAPADRRWALLSKLRSSRLRGQPVIVLDGIIGGVELWKFLHFADQMHRVELGLAGPDLAMIKSAEPLRDVTNPTCLAILAVTDHINAGLGLLVDDVCNFVAQKLRESRRIVGQTLLARRHDLANGGRPYEAADVRDKDTIRAAFHASFPSSLGTRGNQVCSRLDRLQFMNLTRVLMR
jgi:hypothetical protein